MIDSQSQRGCLYRQLDNGIHEFTFTGQTNTGVDEFFEKLEAILRATPMDDTLRYLVDTTQAKGQAPMREMLQRFRQLEARVKVRARGRTVILHNGGIFLSLADTFINTFAPSYDKTRFLTIDKREEAVAWLLSDK